MFGLDMVQKRKGACKNYCNFYKAPSKLAVRVLVVSNLHASCIKTQQKSSVCQKPSTYLEYTLVA
jgi:hypothetical protein